MDNRQKIGKKGELIAIKYLKLNGYKIIDTNFRTRYGEIDIIAMKHKQVIFFEVKTRTNENYGLPIEAINKRKQEKIYNTAKYYLYINDMLDFSVRIDAIEVYFFQGVVKINHVKQVM